MSVARSCLSSRMRSNALLPTGTPFFNTIPAPEAVPMNRWSRNGTIVMPHWFQVSPNPSLMTRVHRYFPFGRTLPFVFQTSNPVL